jgi:hypothetical protein
VYKDADNFLVRPTSRCILFDSDNISFDASLVIYTNSTNIPPIMIINKIYETQNLLLLQFVSFLVGLRTYQHPCTMAPKISGSPRTELAQCQACGAQNVYVASTFL